MCYLHQSSYHCPSSPLLGFALNDHRYWHQAFGDFDVDAAIGGGWVSSDRECIPA